MCFATKHERKRNAHLTYTNNFKPILDPKIDYKIDFDKSAWYISVLDSIKTLEEERIKIKEEKGVKHEDYVKIIEQIEWMHGYKEWVKLQISLDQHVPPFKFTDVPPNPYQLNRNHLDTFYVWEDILSTIY